MATDAIASSRVFNQHHTAAVSQVPLFIHMWEYKIVIAMNLPGLQSKLNHVQNANDHFSTTKKSLCPPGTLVKQASVNPNGKSTPFGCRRTTRLVA
mmetsp:Transcript_147824/g.474524  ORF Transcript_147824/g.474524 Transcript_147824/m.474524 type:complete len:96 (-) Transcript_147824:1111-1398(-)